MRFPVEVIFVCIRWYTTYPLSYRPLKEMVEERGVLVDQGQAVGFLLTTKPDKAAIKRFFDKAMRQGDVLRKVTINKNGANKAAIDDTSAGREIPIVVRQVKYLNNIVEQDHRAVKRVIRPYSTLNPFAWPAMCCRYRTDAYHSQRSNDHFRRKLEVLYRAILYAGWINPPVLRTGIFARLKYAFFRLMRQNQVANNNIKHK